MRWQHGQWGAGEWLAMSLVMLLFWSAVIGLGVWVVRSTGHHAAAPLMGQQSSPRAERVLAERFARGEIDEQEYVRCRDLLRSP